MSKNPIRLAAGLLLASSLTAVHAYAQTGPVVSTTSGPFQGVAGSPVSFLGIPYAAPPVGGLRWKAAQQPATVNAVRQATTFGSSCPQPNSTFGFASTTEDCLTLNVQSPSLSGKRPVMVWLHGGAYSLSKGSAYDGSALIKTGNVVFVSINYRLGIFGFMDYAPVANEVFNQAGNYGLSDQIAALKWVQANIAKFGGDASNVTVFGESAGGASVANLLASPAAKGLFSKAIIESGFFNAYVPPSSQSQSQWATLLKNSTPCGATPTDTCLRSLPVADLLKVTAQPTAGASVLYDITLIGPVSGTPLLPTTPINAFKSGSYNKVPVMNGSNRNEGTGLVAAGFDQYADPQDPIGYQHEALTAPQANPGPIQTFLISPFVGLINSVYNIDQGGAGAVANIIVDGGFACSSLIADDALAASVPVYAYEFNDTAAWTSLVPPSNLFPAGYGATHTSELSYLYPSFQSVYPSVNAAHTPTAAQAALSQSMLTAWTNFATTGNPNGGGAPTWPAYKAGASGSNILSLDTVGSATVPDFTTRHNCSFWSGLLGLDLALPSSILGNL